MNQCISTIVPKRFKLEIPKRRSTINSSEKIEKILFSSSHEEMLIEAHCVDTTQEERNLWK